MTPVGQKAEGIVTDGLVAWYDFVPGGNAQVLYDKWAFGLHGQLGSTSGADTNDPTWTAQGLIYGADDYVVVPAAPQINNVMRTTIMSVIRPDGWGGGSYGRIREKGNGSVMHVRDARVQFNRAFSVTPAGWYSEAGSIALGTAYTVAVTYDQGSVLHVPVFYINRHVSATSVVTAPEGVASDDSASNLYFGNNSSANRNFDGPQCCYLEYNRILTPAEIAQNHQVLRGIMARRGLVITV